MGNVLQQIYIQKYYDEYFETINKYKNITRHSLFCIYLNINKNVSVYNNESSSSLLKHGSGVIYDSYEYTPLQSFDQLINTSQFDQTTKGYKFNGESRISIYTIYEPNIGDLILFPYTSKNTEIFRVKEISSQLSSKNNDQNFFFQLVIEYAPLIDLKTINIANKYVYLITENINIQKTEYINLIKDIDTLNSLFKKTQFNDDLELYYTKENNNIIISLYENKIIYLFLKEYRNYFDLFIKMPFGILNFSNINKNTFLNSNGEMFKLDETKFSLEKINLIDKILNYEYRKIKTIL